MKIITLDYETDGIQARPDYPPKPVSLSYKIGNKPSKFLAWGHPCENNCVSLDAYKLLLEWWNDPRVTMLFHNAKFELEVTYHHFGLPMLPYNRYEDSMVIAYLHDPREVNLELKKLADKYLNMPPNEQEELRDWIIANVPGVTVKSKDWGAHISKAPGKLVGKYARGDTDRTYFLYQELSPYVFQQGMSDANSREKKLNPTIIGMERGGIQTDVNRLQQDHPKYERLYTRLEKECSKILGGININSGPQLSNALLEGGFVDDLPLTKKGNYKTGRDVLEEHVLDQRLKTKLQQHSKLSKILSSYMRKWVDTPNGIIYPWFSATRGERRGGTKTGRFSSNFQQVPKEPDDPKLPFMRDYIVAPPGYVLLKRDYSQQELRILAHLEHDALLDLYTANPFLDLHDEVKAMILKASGVDYDRSFVKQVNFGTIYGMGIAGIAKKLGIPYAEAEKLKRQHTKALPGLRKVNRELRRTARRGDPIYTHGGREYFAEEGFEYRLLNIYVQGSAADHTKEAMIRVDEAIAEYDARILIQVHDELILLAHEENWEKVNQVYKEVMEFKYFDVITPSDGSVGVSWGDMKKVA